MRKRKAKLLMPVVAVGAAVLAVSGGLASADGPSTRGEVHISRQTRRSPATWALSSSPEP